MTDPVKVIQQVGQRVGRLAALQRLIAPLPALIVLLAAGFGLGLLGQHSWERWGLQLPAPTARFLQFALWGAAGLGLAVAAVTAAIAFARSKDPVAAAELIDRRLACHEEILTLATLVSSGDRAARSGLFPLLWRRAAQHLERLEPACIFPFQLKATLRQALFLTMATMGLMAAAISVLLAANRPPFFAEARHLRKIAREIAHSSPGDPEAAQLAAHLRSAAIALNDPKVPPQQKMEQLARVEQELNTRQQQHQTQTAASKGQSGAKGSGKGTQGQGAGESQESAGNAQQGTGAGKGNGKGTGGGANQPGKGEAQIAEARADITRVQARLEAEAKQRSGQSERKNGLKGRAPHPGEQPQLASLEKPGNLPELNQSKAGREHNQEQSNSQRQQPGEQRKNYGSSQGDTHLGQFPQPGNFERFYKAGEHGTPMDIKNARYVLFRVPPAQISAGGGKSVTDTGRPSATVPYANLPLKEERIAAEPDEQQLVPPRYRDLLR